MRRDRLSSSSRSETRAAAAVGCLELPLFTELPRETVWKIVSGGDGGVRSAPWRAGDTPRIYPTTNGIASVRIFPSPQGEDVLGCTAYGQSSTPSSTCSRAAAPGGCCPATSRPGRPSTTGSGGGASTARSSGSTPPCAGTCGRSQVGTLDPALASLTPSPRRLPVWVVSSEDTTGWQEGTR